MPLENVKQHPLYHPDGDALYHSLQVFDFAKSVHPYDEEFLLAALLHDVGKAIDPQDHVRAGLESLDGFITERIHWLIKNQMEAHRLHAGKPTIAGHFVIRRSVLVSNFATTWTSHLGKQAVSLCRPARTMPLDFQNRSFSDLLGPKRLGILHCPGGPREAATNDPAL